MNCSCNWGAIDLQCETRKTLYAHTELTPPYLMDARKIWTRVFILYKSTITRRYSFCTGTKRYDSI